MCFGGGGGGDGGAGEARAEEAERQKRITAGKRKINLAFDGGWAGTKRATKFNPKATYFDEFGNKWSPKSYVAPGSGADGRLGSLMRSVAPILMSPESQFKSGSLYTDRERRSGFDNKFYRGISDAYKDFYLPRVDEQYDNANRKTTFRLANTGNLDSSAGANTIANLFRDYNRERASIGDQALGAERDMRSNVEQNRSDLLNQLQATADPSAAAASATARAKSLAMPEPFKPLSDLFQQYTGAVRDSVALQSLGYRGVGFKAPNPSSSQKIIW